MTDRKTTLSLYTFIKVLEFEVNLNFWLDQNENFYSITLTEINLYIQFIPLQMSDMEWSDIFSYFFKAEYIQ